MNDERYFIMRIRANYNKYTVGAVLKKLNLSKPKINYIFANNCCYVNGTNETIDKVLLTNDYLMIDISNFEKKEQKVFDYKLDILYEDDYLLIINKPTGFIIYSDDANKNTIDNMIANYYQQIDLFASVRHCHRLDTETTGCLIYAKDMITHSAISKMFEDGTVKKNYLAIVEGIINKDGSINTSIGKDRHISGKMVIYRNGQYAKTNYKVVSKSDKATLLDVAIETGRTHQIRVHLSSILHPLYGDSLYGAVTTSRVMLHCHKLNFVHPILGTRLEITAPLPHDFRSVLKKERLTC